MAHHFIQVAEDQLDILLILFHQVGRARQSGGSYGQQTGGNGGDGIVV